MNPMFPYDLVIGLDRSDRKADLHLIDPRSGTSRKQTIATAPESLHDWLAQGRGAAIENRVEHLPVMGRKAMGADVVLSYTYVMLKPGLGVKSPLDQ